MSRLVPYRSKVPPAIKERIDQTLAATMYLVQTTGPTSYVIQEQNSEKKHKVLIGSLQSCSCADMDVCIHILFVMLKVLRVPATSPIVWQKSLIDSEIDGLLRGDYRETSRPAPKPVGTFLKKSKLGAAASPQTEAEETAVQRHDLVPGEVCAICQEDMHEDQPLTHCRKGCGNNFHIECMKVFGESRKQSKENIICPLCRHDWGDLALTVLKKEIEVANKAPNVHKGVGCKKCQTKPIRNERYRCVQCKNTDLCDRCFKSSAHINHFFVMKKMVSDAWVPALRPNQRRTDLNTNLVQELQNRDITTNDYDLLLQLDQREVYPIQDYLLSVLGGQKVLAANAKSFGEAGALCTLCRQSLRIQADVRAVLCGHIFHESCLARSVLSQVYVCPQSGCDRVLFPGLHHLAEQANAKLVDHDTQGGLQSGSNRAASLLEASFCIMPVGLQQTRSSPETASRGKVSSRDVRRLDHQHPSTKTSLPQTGSPDMTLLTIGLAPAPRSAPLPPVDSARQVVSRQSKPGSSAIRTEHRLTPSEERPESSLHRDRRNELPSLVNENVSSSDDRLKHAEDLRQEKRQMDKERLRKQRVQREERLRHHQSNNDSNHAEHNTSLPVIGHADRVDKFTKAQENRAQSHQRARTDKEAKRKLREDHISQYLEARTLPQASLDLSIGFSRRE